MDFVTRTQALTVKLKTVLSATSTADWATRLNEMKSEILAWRQEYDRLETPSTEELAAIRTYTTTLGEILMKGASFHDSAPAAGGGRMSVAYCKKTPCRKMGFSQRASCHRVKSCPTRRARRTRSSR